MVDENKKKILALYKMFIEEYKLEKHWWWGTASNFIGDPVSRVQSMDDEEAKQLIIKIKEIVNK